MSQNVKQEAMQRIDRKLKENLLEEKVGLRWQKTHKHHVQNLYLILQELRGWLHDARPTPRITAIKQAANIAWELVEQTHLHFGNPKSPAAKEFWRTHTTREIDEAIQAVRAAFRGQTPVPQKQISRRSFVKTASQAAAAATVLAAGANFGLGRFEEQWQEGLYLQFAAHSTLDRAKITQKQFQQRGIETSIFKSLDKTGPFKVLMTVRYEELDQAMVDAERIRINLGMEEIGIIFLNPETKRTLWLAKQANEVLKEQEELTPKKAKKEQPDFWKLVNEAIQTYATRKKERIDPLLAWAIIKTESSFNPKAESPVGAMGLMQLMPRMWDHFHGGSAKFPNHELHECNPFDPAQSIDAGVHMLTYLHDKYKPNIVERFKKIIMAYNTGETNLNKAIREDGTVDENLLEEETRKYEDKVIAAKKHFTNVINTGASSPGR